MEKDKVFREWVDGVSLGSAWWAYADIQKTKRFRELQQAASLSDPAPHVGFRDALENEVVGRLCSGELQGFGIEYGSTGEPIAIPKNYFWKGAEIDFDNNSVTALGRKFGQVTVHGCREPTAEYFLETATIDPQRILAELEPLRNAPVAPNWPANPSAGYERKQPVRPLPSGAASPQIISEPRRGRSSRGRGANASRLESGRKEAAPAHAVRYKHAAARRQGPEHRAT
jgi:hypothetical protein